MDRARYLIALVSLVVLVPGAPFWLIIHTWARWWRKLGPALTYLIVVPPLIFLGVFVYRARRLLLSADLGTNWVLIAIAAVFYALEVPLELQYWKYLSISTLTGVPELSSPEKRKGKLLREGIYGVVRHPRYLSAVLGLIGQGLFCNNVGLYVFLLLLVPVGWLTVTLEERELVDRFGEAYRQYQREVPPLIPRRLRVFSR